MLVEGRHEQHTLLRLGLGGLVRPLVEGASFVHRGKCTASLLLWRWKLDHRHRRWKFGVFLSSDPRWRIKLMPKVYTGAQNRRWDVNKGMYVCVLCSTQREGRWT